MKPSMLDGRNEKASHKGGQDGEGEKGDRAAVRLIRAGVSEVLLESITDP
jgi:hypothetical protein